MIAEIAAWGVLTALLIFQQVYWMYQCQRLIDKLMSRSYGDVVLADKYKRAPQVVREKEEPVEDYAAEQASKANLVFGL